MNIKKKITIWRAVNSAASIYVVQPVSMTCMGESIFAAYAGKAVEVLTFISTWRP